MKPRLCSQLGEPGRIRHQEERSPQSTDTKLPSAQTQQCPVLALAFVISAPLPRDAQTLQPVSLFYLISSPTTREEVAIIMTMQRDVENIGVSVEDLLGPIAMVNILEGQKDWENGPFFSLQGSPIA